MEQLNLIHQCKKQIDTWYEVSIYLQYWRQYILRLNVFDAVSYTRNNNVAIIKATSEKLPSINMKFGYKRVDTHWEFFYEDKHTKSSVSYTELCQDRKSHQRRVPSRSTIH